MLAIGWGACHKCVHSGHRGTTKAMQRFKKSQAVQAFLDNQEAWKQGRTALRRNPPINSDWHGKFTKADRPFYLPSNVSNKETIQ